LGCSGATCTGVCKLLGCTQAQLTAGTVAGTGMSQSAIANPNANVLAPFTDISSWYWTYSLQPAGPGSQNWGNTNEKEFVPLLQLKHPIPKNLGSCTLSELNTANTCTVKQIVDILNQTKAQNKVEYLMGYNEPYAGSSADTTGQAAFDNKGAKTMDPVLGADVWRQIVQPVAEQTGLKLVSPTTGISSQKASWLITFLQACYDQRNNATFPCDVTKIVRWSIHEYKCFGSYWRKYAAVDGGDDVVLGDPTKCGGAGHFAAETNLYTAFRQAMLLKYGQEVAESFWYPYINNTKLWVTETSCGGDNSFNKTATKAGVTAPPGNNDQCKYITGQDCQRQEGSIKAMLNMPNIERFSWFTLLPHPPLNDPNYADMMAGAELDYTTGGACAVGSAFTSLLNETVSCDGTCG